jgi:hypothetical protein
MAGKQGITDGAEVGDLKVSIKDLGDVATRRPVRQRHAEPDALHTHTHTHTHTIAARSHISRH